MTFAATRLDGPAVHADIRSRRPRLSPAQSLNRRNAYWLFAVEVGLPDPLTGLCVPLSVGALAAIFGHPKSTVQKAIASARAAKALVAEVAAGD